MDDAIYQVWMVKPSEAFYALSKEDQDAVFAQVDEAQKAAGTESLLMCDSSWSSEKWLYFGVNRFANFEMMRKHYQGLAKFNWHRYIHSQLFLGRPEMPLPPLTAPADGQMPIYKLAVIHMLPDGWRAPQEERDQETGKVLENLNQVGGELMLFLRLYSSDYYTYLNIERFPDLAAVSAHTDCMIDMGWFQWLEADVLLGTQFQG